MSGRARLWTAGALLALLLVLGLLYANHGGDPEPLHGPAHDTERKPQLTLLTGRKQESKKAAPASAPEAAPGTTPAEATPVIKHRVHGRVTDIHNGRALAGAVVRAFVGEDAWDLRDATEGVFSTTSGDDGGYELTMELRELPAHVVLTAELHGYASPSTDHTPEEQVEVAMAYPFAQVQTAGASKVDLPLYPGITFGGTVVDQDGTPIPGVEVLAGERGGETWTRYIENTRTDAKGRFRIYDLTPASVRAKDASGWVEFTHPLHTQVELKDVYKKKESDRLSLRVVMPKGLTIRGTLTHADGTAASNVLVVAYRSKPNDNRRGVHTAEDGTFELQGLARGRVTFRALHGETLTYLRKELRILRSEDDLDLRLERLPDSHAVKRERLLGIEFIKMPDAMHKALEMYKSYHLLITTIDEEVPAPFRDVARPGHVLWNVRSGAGTIASKRDLVEAMLDRVAWRDKFQKKKDLPLADPCRVGIVLGFRTEHMDGTRGTFLHIPRAELEALRSWLESLPDDE